MTPTGLAQDRPPPTQTALSQTTQSQTTQSQTTQRLSCGEALTVWRKAREPSTRQCCAHLIRARASLWTRPARSRELAETAQSLCPTSLEAAVTVAMSVLLQGSASEADQMFERSRTQAGAATWARLGAMDRLLAARAAGMSGARNRALDHYRSVILELDLIPSPHERARILLEGALLAARARPPQPEEAEAYLRQSGDHIAPRLAAVRRLVMGIIEGRASADGRSARELGEEDSDVVLWMQTAAGHAPLAAPGGLLPAVEPEILRELLSSGDELEALP